ncbi:MAG: hypothetical protein OQL28_03950 [Sedimenticola sp.]|nr:hypothetical protein [Sedimenticola sp.]
MKRMIITALLSLATLGVASANYQTDKQYDLLYSDHRSGQMDARQLPPTAAGKQEDRRMNMQPHFGGMQDHPSERPSGI